MLLPILIPDHSEHPADSGRSPEDLLPLVPLAVCHRLLHHHCHGQCHHCRRCHPHSSSSVVGDADLHTLLRDEQAWAGVLPVHSLADGDGPGAGPQLLLLAHGVCVQEEFASGSENAAVRWRRNYFFLHTFHNISLFQANQVRCPVTP